MGELTGLEWSGLDTPNTVITTRAPLVPFEEHPVMQRQSKILQLVPVAVEPASTLSRGLFCRFIGLFAQLPPQF